MNLNHTLWTWAHTHGSLMEGREGESWSGYKVKEKAWFWLWWCSSLSWEKPGDVVCLWQWFYGEGEANAKQKGEGNWWRGRGRAQTRMACGQSDPLRLSRRRKTWLHRQCFSGFGDGSIRTAPANGFSFLHEGGSKHISWELKGEEKVEGLEEREDLKWSPSRNVSISVIP